MPHPIIGLQRLWSLFQVSQRLDKLVVQDGTQTYGGSGPSLVKGVVLHSWPGHSASRRGRDRGAPQRLGSWKTAAMVKRCVHVASQALQGSGESARCVRRKRLGFAEPG
jgi:hypothetical protein